ncbi:hypothetical protein BV22DRAFT_967902, partial [Leucogyrophana mollusca]
NYTEDSAPARRTAVRPRHMAEANRLIAPAFHSSTILGGWFTSEAQGAAPGDKNFMIGPALIYEAGSIEAAHKLVEQDLHWTERV